MEDVCSLLLHQFEITRFQGEAGLADVSFNNSKISRCLSRELRDSRDLFSRTRQQQRLNQQDEIAVFSCEAFQQAIRNKTRKPGYEQCFSIRHGAR